MPRRRGRSQTPPTISNARRTATSPGPAPRTRIAANGNAVRVTSEPKIETVAALKTRTKSRLRQIEPAIAGHTGTERSGADDVGPERGQRDDHPVHCARLGGPEPVHHPDARGARRRASRSSPPRSPARPVFDSLSERLRKTLADLTGRGRVSEADVDAAMREIRLAPARGRRQLQGRQGLRRPRPRAGRRRGDPRRA